MTTPTTGRTAIPARVLGLIVLIVLSLALCGVAVSLGWVSPSALQQAVDSSGWQGRVVFVLLVILMELLWLPRMWPLLAAGALFGPVEGVLLSLVSDTLSALICYAIARGAGRDWVAHLIARRPRARRVVALLARRRGGLTVALLRSTPIAHYTLVSYLAGLTGVAFWPFLIGNAIGLLPGALLYAVVGDAAMDPSSPVFIVGVVLFILAGVVGVFIARRVLKQTTQEHAVASGPSAPPAPSPAAPAPPAPSPAGDDATPHMEPPR